MLSQSTTDKMDKKAGKVETPVEPTPPTEGVKEDIPPWAQALMGEVTALRDELATSEEARAGMVSTIADQELKLQQVGDAMVPVAPSQPFVAPDPVTYETAKGNMRTDR